MSALVYVIWGELGGQGMNLDAHLSARERSEVFAFISMLQSPLQTAMECEWYLNEANWQNVVKPLYGTGSFPANWLLPKQVSPSRQFSYHE